MRTSSLNIAVVGLQFGSAFVPIYQRHPDVGRVAICDPSPEQLQRAGERFAVGAADQFESFEALLADPGIDAVHVVSPVRFHAPQVLAALNAGKHCACAVPMATTEEDLRAILAAQRSSGKNYMMMETAVYTREFFYAQDLLRRGELGRLTFLRGAHLQDIEGLPDYWKGYPPMHYITHALSPLLALAGTRAEKVFCLGSGTLRDDLRQTDAFRGVHGADNPFPLETALFRLAGTDLAAEVTMSFFQNARAYTESFDVYGDRGGFEWQQLEHDGALFFRLEDLPSGRRGRPVTTERVTPPFRPDLLPSKIAEFTTDGGHGGSHPHLVHEFVRSIVEGRAPAVDAVTAANWTAPGLCAHRSALLGGEPVLVPDFAI